MKRLEDGDNFNDAVETIPKRIKTYRCNKDQPKESKPTLTQQYINSWSKLPFQRDNVSSHWCTCWSLQEGKVPPSSNLSVILVPENELSSKLHQICYPPVQDLLPEIPRPAVNSAHIWIHKFISDSRWMPTGPWTRCTPTSRRSCKAEQIVLLIQGWTNCPTDQQIFCNRVPSKQPSWNNKAGSTHGPLGFQTCCRSNVIQTDL